jgi:hypothetical protein
MNHRIVTAVVTTIIALLVATSLAFAWSIEARVAASKVVAVPVTIPHPVSPRNDACTGCHNGTGVPPTHRYFVNAACQSCHSSRVVTLVPHSISMGDARCPLCHGDPDSDLGIPRDHLAFHEQQRCLFCHDVDGAKASTEPTVAGVAARALPPLTHPLSGAFAHCLYCHRIGGTPVLPASHISFTEESCRWCHVRQSAETTPTP